MSIRRTLSQRAESWPIAGTFTIARGSKSHADVIVAEISEGNFTGRGECVPYRRYGETMESVAAQIDAARPAIEAGILPGELLTAMPGGAARNALDAALIDLACKTAGQRVWDMFGLPCPAPKPTCFTISLDTPDAMAQAALAARERPILKLKLGRGPDDADRVKAVRDAVPDTRLVVDANEGWQMDQLVALAPILAGYGIELIEQPLPAGKDNELQGYQCPVVLCADESMHGTGDLQRIGQRYGAVNLKLDKTGGLTAALETARAARAKGLRIMLGCMVGTSLSMAPAAVLMDFADYVDLDGPLLLARDRDHGLKFDRSCVMPPDRELWG